MLKDKFGRARPRGAMVVAWVLGIALVLVVIGVIAIQPERQAITGEVVTTDVPSSVDSNIDAVVRNDCGSNRDYTLTWTISNPLNATADETFDTTTEFYRVNLGTNTLASDGSIDGNPDTRSTDSTSGSVSLGDGCGRRYAAAQLSTTGVGGDSGTIKSIGSMTGVKNAEVVNGVLYFTAVGSAGTIRASSHQHGIPELKINDEVNDAWLPNETGAGTGLTFQHRNGTIFNASADTNANSELRYRIHLRGNGTLGDEDFNDQGFYVVLDYDTTIWDDTREFLTVVGGSVVDAEADNSLTPTERTAYSNSERIWRVTPDGELTSKEIILTYTIWSQGGQDPTGAHNITMGFAPIGRYASTSNSNVLKVGSVDDSTSRTVVYPRHSVIFRIDAPQ